MRSACSSCWPLTSASPASSSSYPAVGCACSRKSLASRRKTWPSCRRRSWAAPRRRNLNTSTTPTSARRSRAGAIRPTAWSSCPARLRRPRRFPPPSPATPARAPPAPRRPPPPRPRGAPGGARQRRLGQPHPARRRRPPERRPAVASLLARYAAQYHSPRKHAAGGAGRRGELSAFARVLLRGAAARRAGDAILLPGLGTPRPAPGKAAAMERHKVNTKLEIRKSKLGKSAAQDEFRVSSFAFRPLLTTLRMIRFEHSVFALPFALLGALLAAGGWPTAWQLFWIVVAMVAGRSAAMAFNRIADLGYDRENPRTAGRELPTGKLSVGFA